MALFSGNENHHGTHGEPVLDPIGGAKWAIGETASTRRGGPTLGMWEKHLAGERPLGVTPTREDGTCTWGSIDVDEYDVDEKDVIARVEAAKLPLLPSWSKSGGLHLFLFAKEPVQAALMQSTLRDVAASLGFAGCEIFPKQVFIEKEKGELGSWMTMPYLGTTYGGKLREQAGVKRTGALMTLPEFLATAEKMRVDPATIQVARSGERGGKKSASKKERPPFSDGPPCVAHLTALGVAQGGQNNFLFHIGVFYKKKYPEDWKKRLETANQEFCRPPYPSDKLSLTIKSLEKKDYQYKCKDQPMVSHCDSMLCRTRKFGVGAGATYPEITSISKLNTDPPLWFVDVENVKITCSTEELQQYQRFHRLCMERTHKSFAMISQNVWVGVLNEALAHLTLIQAPDEVGIAGQFRELLEEFLTNRQRGQVRDDLASGRPWEDEENGRHYFQLRPFVKFVEREGLKDLARHRNRITQMLRDLGGGPHSFNLKSGYRNVWFLPSDVVRKTGEAEMPKQDGDEM